LLEVVVAVHKTQVVAVQVVTEHQDMDQVHYKAQHKN